MDLIDYPGHILLDFKKPIIRVFYSTIIHVKMRSEIQTSPWCNYLSI